MVSRQPDVATASGCGLRPDAEVAVRRSLGVRWMTAGCVEVEGGEARIRDVTAALHGYRIGHISEDREAEGLNLFHSVTSNIGITI